MRGHGVCLGWEEGQGNQGGRNWLSKERGWAIPWCSCSQLGQHTVSGSHFSLQRAGGGRKRPSYSGSALANLPPSPCWTTEARLCSEQEKPLARKQGITSHSWQSTTGLWMCCYWPWRVYLSILAQPPLYREGKMQTLMRPNCGLALFINEV